MIRNETDKWNTLISKFRDLGGIADNICQKNGSKGRGIFPVDKKIKSRIFTPSNLIIKKDDICLESGNVRIKKEKNYYPKETREFFNYYQDNFSWGGGGKESTEKFESSLSLFSEELKKLLKENRLVDIDKRHEGSWKEVILSQFLYAREFNFKNNLQIVPLLELVNHDTISFQFYKSSKGISSPNYPPLNSELTYTYASKGTLNCFFDYGFFSKETMVFSLPFNFKIEDTDLTLICKGNELRDDLMNIKRHKNSILIEGLPISDRNYSSLPEEYFMELFRQIGLNDISLINLYKIKNYNKIIREKFLENISKKENIASSMFYKAIVHELDLISKF